MTVLHALGWFLATLLLWRGAVRLDEYERRPRPYDWATDGLT